MPSNLGKTSAAKTLTLVRWLFCWSSPGPLPPALGGKGTASLLAAVPAPTSPQAVSEGGHARAAHRPWSAPVSSRPPPVRASGDLDRVLLLGPSVRPTQQV